MSDFHWYSDADTSRRGSDSLLGNSCWTLPYLYDSMKKQGVMFRYVPVANIGDQASDGEYYSWHFTIAKSGTIYQHYPTQAVTRSRLFGTGWGNSYCLEANCVVIAFEGPLLVNRHLCHIDGQPDNIGWFYCSEVVDSDVYTHCDVSKMHGCTCYWVGTTRFPGSPGAPLKQAQLNSAVDLVRWLIYSAYGLGEPMDGQNVFGASDWGDPIFDMEPGPAPGVVPWQWPISGGYISQGYNDCLWVDASGTCLYGCDKHAALDIAGISEGTAVYPAAGNPGGTGCYVVDRGYGSVEGYWIRLRHVDKAAAEIYSIPLVDTVYYHLREKAHAAPGQWIKMSDRIGSVGSTGSASGGTHLHLGVYEWPNAATKDADGGNDDGRYAGCSYRKDPMLYLPAAE